MLPSEGLSFPLMDFVDLVISHAIAVTMIPKIAIPTPIPAFSPVLRPPDEMSPLKAEDEVGVKADDVVVEEAGVNDEKGIAEERVDVEPTVAAISKILLLLLQQVFSPQHQVFPPQL